MTGPSCVHDNNIAVQARFVENLVLSTQISHHPLKLDHSNTTFCFKHSTAASIRLGRLIVEFGCAGGLWRGSEMGAYAPMC